MKSKLKELAALCIEKEVVFHCNAEGGSFTYYVYVWIDGQIKYLSGVVEIAADWKADSIERIDEVIALVENYNG